jgi:hypothetical protein
MMMMMMMIMVTVNYTLWTDLWRSGGTSAIDKI